MGYFYITCILSRATMTFSHETYCFRQTCLPFPKIFTCIPNLRWVSAPLSSTSKACILFCPSLSHKILPIFSAVSPFIENVFYHPGPNNVSSHRLLEEMSICFSNLDYAIKLNFSHVGHVSFLNVTPYFLVSRDCGCSYFFVFILWISTRDSFYFEDYKCKDYDYLIHI